MSLWWKVLSTTCLTTGWALVLFAVPPDVPTANPTAEHFQFVLYLCGSVLIFMACNALVVVWLVTPAVDRRFAKHLLSGAEEHKDLLSQAAYTARHEDLMKQISKANENLGRVAERLSMKTE